ncbi:MAG: Holliday junction resolvase [Thermoprotei archaeon]|jgi:Holliday junction resolvase|nr:Holliday junction resolvase [Thermoprotei archaeon]
MSDYHRKNRRRGFQKERDLVRKLWDMGFATIRAPASGAKAKKTYQPDIIAAKNNRILVIEVKTRSSSDVVYIDQYQVEKVLEWVKRAGSNATGMIAVYFDRRQGWRFVPIESAVKLDSGGVKITKEDADKGLPLDKLREI